MSTSLTARVVSRLPAPVQSQIRDLYWRVKSRLLYQRLYQMLDLQYTLATGLTLRVGSKGEWWTYNEIFVNGEYDVPIHAALESYRSDHRFTVLDLGANVGHFALRVVDRIRHQQRKISCDLTLVEGSPTTFAVLRDRIQAQALPEADMRMFHGLVGNRTGSATIHQSAIHVKNTLFSADGDGASVPFLDLIPLMAGRSTIDLLKCDIEGAELLFLENHGELMGKVQHAVFELHDLLCDVPRCIALLAQMGFREHMLYSKDKFSVRMFSRG
jgi:FkbM family methyltransferase